jgi:SOS-response transcriptional repressor LexA
MMSLTQRQAECLRVIRESLAQSGVPPSFDEMTVRLGLTSKSGVSRLVDALVERGHLRRVRHRARGLALADEFSARAEAGLARIEERTGVGRAELVRRAVEEFVAREALS